MPYQVDGPILNIVSGQRTWSVVFVSGENRRLIASYLPSASAENIVQELNALLEKTE